MFLSQADVFQTEGSVLWSGVSVFSVCCLQSVSPLSCVSFPTSTVVSSVLGLWDFCSKGLIDGVSGASNGDVILLGSLGDTAVLPKVWDGAGTEVGVFSWVVGVSTGCARV